MKDSVNPSYPTLTAVGLLLIVSTALLAWRIIWEETILTMQEGPQMVGFSLAHGSAAPLLFAPIALALWLLAALAIIIVAAIRKRAFIKPLSLTVLTAVAILAFISLPPTFWQWLLILNFAKSAHAGELMVDAAAEGNWRTVSGYLAHGVSIESGNYEGSSAAFAASVGGNLQVIKLLADKGANLNATNFYGDSPLQAAVEGKHDRVAKFLREHGAKQIEGTPEQRLAASHAIVQKQIQQMKR